RLISLIKPTSPSPQLASPSQVTPSHSPPATKSPSPPQPRSGLTRMRGEITVSRATSPPNPTQSSSPQTLQASPRETSSPGTVPHHPPTSSLRHQPTGILHTPGETTVSLATSPPPTTS